MAVTPGGAAPPTPSRFFVLRTDQVPEPTPSAPVDPALLSEPGESAKDLAECITADVLDDPMVTTGVEDDGDLHLVTLRSSTGVVAVAAITENGSGSLRFEGVTTTGPFDLVESSWLRLDLTTADGRILHQLVPR